MIGKKILHENDTCLTSLLSGKKDLKSNFSKERRLSYNDKWINSSRNHDNYKYVCIQLWSLSTYEEYIKPREGENLQK